MNKMFRGAGVIIDYPGQSHTNEETDICIETKFAQELSNIYYQLRDYFSKDIDYFNKFAFYGKLAENYNRLIEKNGDIKDNLRIFLLILEPFLYFAYGSNMDKKQMNERCPGAISIGIATLNNYKFVLDSAGTASVITEKRSKVEGLLWLINTEGIKALDRYEGTEMTPPCYTKEHLKIQFNEENAKALVYVSNRNITNKPIRDYYMKKVINAAKEADLSAEYIKDNLEKFND